MVFVLDHIDEEADVLCSGIFVFLSDKLSSPRCSVSPPSERF